ncbi:hypothetical protein B5C34_05845 [Pacificimonas flava]|uniref:Retropepsin-like aspartic endopeptidase domain-containing protein n=3 Tax=Sphingosinicellaceae TaxID=2820280 RepID=A0A219B908_9SPHN|nr:ATP-dependent zinc protease [Pacificimonas aurantium]OWV34654.1 hypothetical protein B5C34_05845 [Pacificimonas flava]
MARGARTLDTVGWAELVALPDLDIPFVRAKVDTGARTSALHAIRLHHFEKDGREWVRFTVPARKGRSKHRVEAPLAGIKKVRSSNGETQKRFVIRTRFVIGGKRFRAEVTLSNRSQMGYAMLVGRTALKNRFLVDVSHAYMQGDTPPEGSKS